MHRESGPFTHICKGIMVVIKFFFLGQSMIDNTFLWTMMWNHNLIEHLQNKPKYKMQDLYHL